MPWTRRYDAAPFHPGPFVNRCASIGLFVLAVGCHRGPPAPVATEVAVTLDGQWSSKPWRSDPPGPPGGYPIRLTTSFVVPAGLALQPVELELEGLWWSAQVWLDGKQQDVVVGGQPPVRTMLSAGLSEGTHTLELVVQAPRGVSKFAHGGGLGSTTSTERSTLHHPPVLHFGRTPVTTAGVRLNDAGATAWARLDPSAVEAGQQVHFFTALDGRIQTDFGTHPVGGTGEVSSFVTKPEDPLWQWGNPALTHLFVDVLDAAGTSVRRYSVRTGLRSSGFTPAGLSINDTASPAMAIRVLHGLDRPDLLTVFEESVPAGVNAVEVHGDMVGSRLMDLADELGIPVVVLPRCVGRVGRPPGAGASLAETLRSQDQRTVAGVGAHPSVVSWLVEGDRQIIGLGRKETGELPPWTDELPADPMKRPVVGIDIPGTLLQMGDLRTGEVTCPAGCGGKWIVESTFRIVPHPNLWGAVASGWSEAISAGIPGGTLPTPSPNELRAWTAAFAPVVKASGALSFPLDERRRASSRVQVRGAGPGELVWVEAPGTTLVGAQADASGQAVVDVWYDGVATVRGAGWESSVRLEPMEWRGTKVFGHVAEVTVP